MQGRGSRDQVSLGLVPDILSTAPSKLWDHLLPTLENISDSGFRMNREDLRRRCGASATAQCPLERTLRTPVGVDTCGYLRCWGATCTEVMTPEEKPGGLGAC